MEKLKAMSDIKVLTEQVKSINTDNGFFNKYEPVPFPTLVALITTELSEAVEADRGMRYANVEAYNAAIEGTEVQSEAWIEAFKLHIKDTVEDEIADALIRILDLVARYNIDIEYHIEQKLYYNSTRGYKHGKSY